MTVPLHPKVLDILKEMVDFHILFQTKSIMTISKMFAEKLK